MSTIEELSILREREDHIEFKEAKHNYPFAGGKKTEPSERRRCVLGYIVALANERGGRLVLGMADAYPHVVVGSDFADGEIGALEDEIYNRLKIRVHIEELIYEHRNEKLRVVVINVPSRPIGKALRFEGVPLMRVGESLREMDDAEYFSIISEHDPDFSARICKGLTIDDLDNDAIEEMRSLIAKNRNRPSVMSTPLTQLLSDLKLSTAEGLTYAALLLLGKSEVIEKNLPQFNVVIEFRTNPADIRYLARREFRESFFLGIKHIWDYINQPASNPLLHIYDLPRIINVPSYNKETIREAVINAYIHRDLRMTGDILIKQSHEYIEITNPGGFPYGVNRGNIITVNSSPRSRLMAEVIEKTGLIERSGQGVDTIYANNITEGRPLPDYSRSDDYQVSLVIRSEIKDSYFYLFMQDVVAKDPSITVFALLNIYNVKIHHIDELYDSDIPYLLEHGYIQEHPYYKYILGDGYFASMSPVKHGICTPVQLAYIIYCLEEYSGSCSSTSFIERLSNLLTQKQVRLLIEKLVNSGFLTVSGKAKNTRYSLNVETATKSGQKF